MSVLDGRPDVLRPYRAGAGVVQIAVEAFDHQWVDGACTPAQIRILLQHPADHRVGDTAHVQRAAQQQRRFQRAHLPHLFEAHGLAIAIQRVHGGDDLLVKEVAAVRQHRGHARAHAVPLDQRDVPHPHAVHVGDRIE